MSVKKEIVKKLKTFKLNDLIEVEWEDHYGQNGWQELDYVKSRGLLPCKTVGYFVNYDNKSLRMGSTLDAQGQYNSVQHRIMSAITGVRKLK